MKRLNMFVKIGFIILMVGLLMTVSCTKKKPKTGTGIEQQMETQSSQQMGTEGGEAGGTISEEELAAQQRTEEETKAAANADVKVVIEGNCDERGTEEYNIALGQRRAQSIKTFLMNAGISGARLQTISYGEERPVDPASNETAWDKNRRGHFRLER